MTHGFTLDEKGEKMSKSLGNSVEPQDIIAKSGAEILRLWAALADYSEDQRIGPTILQTTVDAYRKLRNTLRYLLGALDGFERSRAGRRWQTCRRWSASSCIGCGSSTAGARRLRAATISPTVVRPLADFCSNDLSALFFDIRRDALYCDRPDSVRRRACRTVMDLAFERLTDLARPGPRLHHGRGLEHPRFPTPAPTRCACFPRRRPNGATRPRLTRWERVERVTRVVTGALEVERREKRLGAALEAAPRVHIADPALLAAFDGLDAAEVFRTSQATLIAGEGPPGAFRLEGVSGVAVEPLRAEGRKCARSWRILPEVGSDPRYPDLSLRDADAVAWREAHSGPRAGPLRMTVVTRPEGWPSRSPPW